MRDKYIVKRRKPLSKMLIGQNHSFTRRNTEGTEAEAFGTANDNQSIISDPGSSLMDSFDVLTVTNLDPNRQGKYPVQSGLDEGVNMGTNQTVPTRGSSFEHRNAVEVITMPYKSCRLKIYKKLDRPGLFFYEPAVELEEVKFIPSYHQIRLKIRMWTTELEEQVVNWMKRLPTKIAIEDVNVQVMDYEEIRLVTTRPTGLTAVPTLFTLPEGPTNYSRLDQSLQFYLSCGSSVEEDEARLLAEEILLDPSIHFLSLECKLKDRYHSDQGTAVVFGLNSFVRDEPDGDDYVPETSTEQRENESSIIGQLYILLQSNANQLAVALSRIGNLEKFSEDLKVSAEKLRSQMVDLKNISETSTKSIAALRGALSGIHMTVRGNAAAFQAFQEKTNQQLKNTDEFCARLQSGMLLLQSREMHHQHGRPPQTGTSTNY